MFRQVASVVAEKDDGVRERVGIRLLLQQAIPRMRRGPDAPHFDWKAYSRRLPDLLQLQGDCQMRRWRLPTEPHAAVTAGTEINAYSSQFRLDLARAVLNTGDLKRAEFALYAGRSFPDELQQREATPLTMGYVHLRQKSASDSAPVVLSRPAAPSTRPIPPRLCMVGIHPSRKWVVNTGRRFLLPGSYASSPGR